jgi:hypothetical protein
VLTRAIAGETGDAIIFELARRVAEAQINLQRVRQARRQFLADRSNGLGHPRSPNKGSDPDPGSLDEHEVATTLVEHFQEVESNRPLRAAGIVTPQICCSRTRRERRNTQVNLIGQNAFFGRTKPINLEKTKVSGVLVTVAPVIVCRADVAYLHGLSWCWLS